MKYKIGMKIKIINMKNEPEYNNKIGFIEFIDAIGQLHGTWGSLAVIPEIDIIQIMENNNETNNK